MIEERKLLEELIKLMHTDIPPSVNAILRIAQQAEALFETERPVVMEIDRLSTNQIFYKLEDIMNPSVSYSEDHLKMSKQVIKENQEIARIIFVDLEMLIQ